jgi:antitoxin component of MazEF toxin-antitoxin module
MSKVFRCGHALAVRLPKSIVQVGGIKEGSEVSVRLLDNGCLLITPLHGTIVITPDHVPKRVDPQLEDW